MSVVPVYIRFKSNKLLVNVDLNEPPSILKMQVTSITGIPAYRQKLIFKRQIIKDDTWDGITILENAEIFLTGSVEPENYERDEDVHDLLPTHESIYLDKDADTKKSLPIGFNNLGNTCFMSAVWQLLKAMPEFLTFLEQNPLVPATQGGVYKMLHYMRMLFLRMDPSTDPRLFSTKVNLLVLSSERLIPEILKENPGGGRMQQDASEYMIKLIDLMKPAFPSHLFQTNLPTKYDSILDCLFNVEFEEKTVYPNDRPTKTIFVRDLMVSCNLTKDAKELYNAIALRLDDVVELKDEFSGEVLLCKRTLRFSRLPMFLFVHLPRFFFRKDKNTNAKILREIKLPETLDLFNLCSPTYQETMKEMRQLLCPGGKNNSKAMERCNIVKDPMSENSIISLDGQMLDYGTSGSAMYELKAVLTHKGRYSNAGHYITWVKQESGMWLKFNDDTVNAVFQRSLSALFGGTESSSAYIALYEVHRYRLIDDA